MRFSEEIKESITSKLNEIAKEKIKQGENIINMAIGEPNFKVPNHIIEATKNALDLGYTTYSNPKGLKELRTEIKKHYLNKYNAFYDEEEIIILPGAKNAIYLSLASILNENDEVIIISPYYVAYPSIIKLSEPTAKIIDIPLNDDFTLPLKKIKQSINKNTKALILNYPNNPTGLLLNNLEVKEIVKLVKDNDIYLLSDEIYDMLLFKNEKFISFSSYKEIKDKLIIINGYSKTYAMTGFRVGYALSSKYIINKMDLINQNINTNTNTFVQKGILSIYKNNNDHLIEYLKDLELKANYVHDEINKLNYFKGIKPKSTFYYFIDITKTNYNSLDFSNLLLDKYKIAVTPGIAFGKHFDNYIRISLATELKTIKDFISRLKTITL